MDRMSLDTVRQTQRRQYLVGQRRPRKQQCD
jgi:hypothetical protein